MNPFNTTSPSVRFTRPSILPPSTHKWGEEEVFLVARIFESSYRNGTVRCRTPTVRVRAHKPCRWRARWVLLEANAQSLSCRSSACCVYEFLFPFNDLLERRFLLFRLLFFLLFYIYVFIYSLLFSSVWFGSVRFGVVHSYEPRLQFEPCIFLYYYRKKICE